MDCRYVFSRRPVWSGCLYRVKNHCPYPALVCRIIPPLAKKNLSRHIWPLLLGCLTACWWPYLNQSVAPGSLPWHASWTFKTILALIPATAGYLFKWKQYRQRKTKP
ncbi:predicted protein [Neisseria gonorrhoeae 35/02]|nr:predicted protein [Neisseria gonorrhoeae 35/02]